MPAVLVFIPPLMAFAPTSLTRGVQFAPLVISLAAVAPMVFDGVVQLMLGVHNTPLASVDVFGMNARNCSEQYNPCKNGGKEKRFSCPVSRKY
jgi:hypothetical protein